MKGEREFARDSPPKRSLHSRLSNRERLGEKGGLAPESVETVTTNNHIADTLLEKRFPREWGRRATCRTRFIPRTMFYIPARDRRRAGLDN
jgi:hypothetical protein